ncbi:MAG: hypothetical protein JSU07_04195 [Bacteroidetes bacterium]|nr:hypothetical protein [Bacteroidota bacterium]
MGSFKHKSYWFLIRFLLLLNVFCFSQNIDSIEKRLNTLHGVEKIKALNDLCYYTSTTNIDQSILFGNKSCELAKATKDSLLLASCMNDLSISYYYKGNFDSCIILARNAYNIRVQKKQWRDAAASLSKEALGHYEKGAYGISLETNLTALALFEKAKAFKEVYRLQNNIASIYERNNQLVEAKNMHLASAEGALKFKDYESYVIAKSNYAQNLQQLGNVKNAIIIFNELIPVCKQYCREEYLSQIYQSLGVSQRLLNNTQKGLENYLKAKEIYDRIGSLSGMSIINVNIGLCYTDLSKYKEATVFLEKGLKQAIEIKSLLWQKKAYIGLYTLEHNKGNYKLANFYLEKHQKISDSLYNEDGQNKISKLQAQYRLQEKENTILSQKNIIVQNQLIINKRNAYLIRFVFAFVILLLLIVFVIQRNKIAFKKNEIVFQKKIQNERWRISKDLHDNLGAELTIISSAIDIKTYHIEKINDKQDLEKISDQLRKASALMRDTIWTISEDAISITQFGIKIRDFATRAFENSKVKLHFKNTSCDFVLSPESALNLYRIAQETINNSVKHAKAKNFYIELYNNNNITILLKDDGIGFDYKNSKNGYGLTNIAARAKNIGAEIEYKSVLNNYTQVIILFNTDCKNKS